MHKDNIMLSIFCITYNHEVYISDAIESFLVQKTDFEYEILIYDDASTDKTAEIIRGYEKEYPNLIKPIYQIENQYSKGVDVICFNRDRARGKYVAICEGDDFWIDPYKLQKQFNYMEKHVECSMCVHATYRVNSDNKKANKHIRPHLGNKIFTVEEVIEGGGGLFATNSIMYLREKDIERPAFFEKVTIGDYPLVINLSLQGTVYYLDEFMSAYRVNVKESWSSRITTNIEKLVKHYEMINGMLDEINNCTGYKYENSIKNTKSKNKFTIMLAQGKFENIKVGEYKKFYNNLQVLIKIKIFIKQHCPKMALALMSIKRMYK